MAVFFIDTSTGRVATQRQLIEAGVADTVQPPPRPWFRIQGTSDATTMWYAVLRRMERDVYIGTLVLRHTDHYASLLAKGWEEVPVSEIQAM
jgi:alpha/beta superfamily hydrolase